MIRIKHFGRWVVALMLAFILAGWFIKSTVADSTWKSILWVILVLSPVVSLIGIEYRRGAKPRIRTFLVTLMAAVVFAWVFVELDVRWWIRLLLLAVLASPVMSIANALFRGDVLHGQRARDKNATNLARDVMAGKQVQRFILYLRPFVSSDRLMAQALPGPIADTEVPVHLDVETLLARAYRKALPVIALGKSGDTVEGAARVTVADAAWQETVEALALQATFITMLPLSRPGTMWELEWLKKHDLIDKILFIMPETPHQAPDGVVIWEESDDRIFDVGVRQFEAASHMLDLPKEWSNVEREASHLGLAFPALAAVGALFTMNSTSGAVKKIIPFGLTMLARRIRHLRLSVEFLGLLPAEYKQTDFLAEFSGAVLMGGKTLEYALVRAGDGYAVWGDAATALRMLKKAFEAGEPSSDLANEYILELPKLIDERNQTGDARAAANYTEFARHLSADPTIWSVADYKTLKTIDERISLLIK